MEQQTAPTVISDASFMEMKFTQVGVEEAFETVVVVVSSKETLETKALAEFSEG